MSFLNKIKLNYNIKLIDEYIVNKNNVEIYKILKNTKSEKNDFIEGEFQDIEDDDDRKI